MIMPPIHCSSTGSHSGRTCQCSPVSKRLRNPPPATLIIGLHACSLWIFFPLSNLLTDYLVFGREGACVTEYLREPVDREILSETFGIAAINPWNPPVWMDVQHAYHTPYRRKSNSQWMRPTVCANHFLRPECRRCLLMSF